MRSMGSEGELARFTNSWARLWLSSQGDVAGVEAIFDLTVWQSRCWGTPMPIAIALNLFPWCSVSPDRICVGIISTSHSGSSEVENPNLLFLLCCVCADASLLHWVQGCLHTGAKWRCYIHALSML